MLKQYKHHDIIIEEVKENKSGEKVQHNIEYLLTELRNIKNSISYLERENRRLKTFVETLQNKK